MSTQTKSPTTKFAVQGSNTSVPNIQIQLNPLKFAGLRSAFNLILLGKKVESITCPQIFNQEDSFLLAKLFDSYSPDKLDIIFEYLFDIQSQNDLQLESEYCDATIDELNHINYEIDYLHNQFQKYNKVKTH